MNKNNITYSIYNGDIMKFIIIRNGKLNFKNMIKNNIKLENIFLELRKRNIKNIESIKLLLVYKKIYIFKLIKDPVSLIIDGKYIYSNLFKDEKNFFWLRKILKKYKLSIRYIKYAVISRNKLFIIKYNN